MDEQNFDKFFGDHLKADEDFPFTDNKWDKMQTHLNTHLAAKRRWRLGAWLSVPLLALLGTLGFMGWSLHNSQQDIRDLTAEIKTLRLEKQASLPLSPQESLQTVSTVKSDTVYHHVVVRRYDTIFQTVVRRDLSDTRSTKSDASFSKINTTILPETKATTTQNNIATDTKPKTQNVTLKDPTLKAEKQENDAVKTTPINKESTDAKSETQNAKLEDPLSKKE